MSTEKRKSERTNIFLLVELRPHNKSQDFILAISTNLSTEGAVIESQGYDLRAGEFLELIIKHPKSDVSVSALGQIAWKKDAWYKCLMGIKFIKIEEEDKNNIIKLMAAGLESTPEPTYQTSDAEKTTPQEPQEAGAETGFTGHMAAPEASVENIDDTPDDNEDTASREIQSDEAVLNSGPLQSDATDAVAPVMETSRQSVEKTESESEEGELELNRAETSRHVAADVSSLNITRKIDDEKERSFKPLVSVLLIIVAAIALIYFEDISRNIKLILSGRDSSFSVPLPKTTASSDDPVSETTNNVASPLQVKNNSDDALSTKADKYETTVEESISSPPAVDELVKKDPPLSANTDEKKSLPSPIKEKPNPSKSLITAQAMTTGQTQNKTEKTRVQLPDNIDSDKKLTAPVRTEKKSPQKTVHSLQRRKAAPKPHKPPIKTAKKPSSVKSAVTPPKTSIKKARTLKLNEESVRVASLPDRPGEGKLSDHGAETLKEKEVLPDMKNDRFTKYIKYEELFNNNKNGWDIFNTESSSATIISGEYRMESKLARGSLINLHHHALPRDRDFQIEVYVKSELDGKNQAYGLVFGARGILNNYVFKITSEGFYSIGKYVMGTWKELRGGKIRDGIIRHNSTNVLKIARKNQKVHFYVNNTYLNKYSITSFDGHQIGFIVQGKTVMAVDRTRSLIESKIQ